MVSCPIKTSPEWKTNTLDFGESSSYTNHVNWLGEVPYSQAVVSNLNSIQVIDSVLSNLKNRFGINYHIVEPSVIAERMGVAVEDAPRGLIDKEGVFINSKKLSLEAVFHEYSHPLVEYLDEVNPELIDNLFNELQTQKGGEYVLRKIRTDKTYLSMGYYDPVSNSYSREGKKEAIVTMLGKLAEQEFGVAMGEELLEPSLVSKLKQFIEDVWYSVLQGLGLEYLINPKTFGYDTKLGDLASVIALTEMSLDMSGKEYVNKPRALTSELNKHAEIFDAVKVFIKERMVHLERSHSQNKTERRRQLKNFAEKYEEQSSNMKKFLYLTDYSYAQMIGNGENSFLSQLDKLISDVNSGVKLDPQKALAALIDFKTFAEDFGGLFESVRTTMISELGVEEFNRQSSEPDSPLSKVRAIVDAADYIKSVQKTYMNTSLAAILYPYYTGSQPSASMKEYNDRINALKSRAHEIEKDHKSKGKDLSKNSIYNNILNEITTLENKKRRDDPSYDNLVKQIQEANEDIGWWDYQTTPAKLSSDGVLSAFAGLLKTKMESLRIKLLGYQRNLRAGLEKYRATVGVSMDFADKFYKDMFELVEIDTGEGLKQAYSFVSEVDVTRYNNDWKHVKEQAWVLEKSGKRDEADKIKREFFKNNRVAIGKDQIDRMISDMQDKVTQGIMSKEELHEIVSRRMYHEGIYRDVNDVYNNTDMSPEQKYKMLYDQLLTAHNNRSASIEYRYEFSQIDPVKYVNKNYSKLKSNPAKFEYYNQLLKQYLADQELLPPSRRNGYVLPQVRKRGWERVSKGEIKKYLQEEIQDTFKFIENDEEFIGNQEATSSDKKYVPIYYTDLLDPDDTSLDLTRSVLLFSRMANKFSTLDNISEVVTALEDVSENRKVQNITKTGQSILKKIASSVGVQLPSTLQGSEANVNKALKGFIDMQVYGELQKVEKVDFLGTTLDLRKISNSLSSWVSKATIGGDFLKAVANMSQAKLTQFVEAGGGEFLTKKSFIKGEQSYYSEVLPDITTDFGKGVPQSFWGRMLEAFDPLQGDWENGFGEQISRSKLLRTLSWDAHFFGIHAGEHYAQVSMLLGMMHDQKVMVNGKEIPLIKLYEPGTNNEPKLREGVDPEWNIGGKKMVEFVNKVHSVNNRLHGVYNKFDTIEAQRGYIGRLLIMFRKFAPPGIAKRYKKIGVNRQTGTVDEGFYRTFFNALIRQRSDLINYLTGRENNLTDIQQGNIKRMITEMTLIGITWIAAMSASNYDEGDDDNYWARFAEYEFTRLNSELFFYLNPADFMRIMKSPSASTNKIMQFLKAFNYTFLTWDPEKLVYQRRTGIWDKGDSKTLASWAKLFGINGYNLNPGEAVKSFKLSTM